MSSQAEVAGALTSHVIELPAVAPLCEEVGANDSLRDRIAESAIGPFSELTTRGGVYLGVRYAMGVLISIGNMFVLTGWIGPHAYGIFVTAIGLTAFLGSLTRRGVDTYLVRRAAAPDEDMYHVASTLIFTFSMVLMALGAAAVPLLMRWYGSREFVPAYATMLLTVPLVGLAGPPTAKLERAMNFRVVAQIELGSQFLALAVSLTLAWRGLGVWAPVFGHLTWQCAGVIAAFWAARFFPRVRFNLACAREMLSFGVGYTASLRTWQLRTLVNPLLVGRFAGSEGVAFVGLAIRIAEGLGFIRIAAARLAIAALSRLQENTEKFRAALEKALEIQVLVLGPLLCGFALLGPLVVQRLIGSRWMPSLQVYPFIATGVLVNSVFNLQASALFVVGEQWVVLKSYASHVVLLMLGTFLLIPHFGLAGYGWADLAACAAYVFLQAGLSRIIGISHRRLALWVVAFTAPLFVHHVPRGWAVALCLPLLLLSVAGTWKWSRASLEKSVTRGSGLRGAVTDHLQHLYTFLLKTRYRGLGYATAVLQYLWCSRTYRLKLALRYTLRGQAIARAMGGAKWRCVADAILQDHSSFHFRAADIPQIVAWVPDRLKGLTVADAEKILQQRFYFRGEERVFADEVDWRGCPQGNTSWTWDLNRHRFFVTLGTAYYYTGDARYLAKLVDLWEHWIKENPVGKTPAWKYPFEVAARLQNWIWAYFLLECPGEWTGEQLFPVLTAMREHGSFLYSNLEYHWPNNHLLLEAKALLEYALLFPQFNESAKLLARAERILEREVAAQVLADGAHSELCSMYHRIIAGELGELTMLCRRNGHPLPARMEERIASLAEFTRALLSENGSAPLLGASAQYDSYIRFDPVQRDYSDLNYWVWRGEPLPSVAKRTGRAPQLAIFPQAGYAFLRSGCTEREVHLAFDFGPFSRCPSANHGHCDALSFELYVAGQPVIVDPGVYLPWTSGNGWSQHFRSTAAHNTLIVDGKEQSELYRFSDVRKTARTRLIRNCVSSDGAGPPPNVFPIGRRRTRFAIVARFATKPAGSSISMIK